jgi:hypothetical protein
MVESVALAAPGSSGRCAVVDGLANREAATMAIPGEPATGDGGVGIRADFSAARPPLRQRDLAGDDRRKTRPRIHLSTPGKTKKEDIIGLIPFLCLIALADGKENDESALDDITFGRYAAYHLAGLIPDDLSNLLCELSDKVRRYRNRKRVGRNDVPLGS